MTTETYDFVIIGAGPAGLAEANRLGKSGSRVLLVDSGSPVDKRDRYGARDLTQGHGGAGLFSDGKFSFYPSASELWALPGAEDLRKAYDWTCELLESYGLDTPPYPENPEDFSVNSGEWVLKSYPSDYLSLDQRIALTENLVTDAQVEVLSETTVTDLFFDPSSEHFELTVESKHAAVLRAQQLIITTGRFGPLQFESFYTEREFRRLEVGFRIEQGAGEAFFSELAQLDPKLRFQDASGVVEWRTFCACRQGEVALSETGGLWTVSGRSDCPATGRSNIGFNTRVLDPEIASRAFQPAVEGMKQRDAHFKVDLVRALEGSADELRALDYAYGPELRKLMLSGVEKLGNKYPVILGGGANLVGPALEGVGFYPTVDGSLQLPGVPAWLAGDACGLFRGIVAAFVSGHYAASAALEASSNKKIEVGAAS